ncbi:hypothetical protein TRIUR3_16196 [Triticum urartu]|uniref:Uncharacterized protein n=1 Tax=Triticum urartu TaxID=4572 RepID=M7YNF1_TRIUA|nr:hypothetical protein TRIUR3_16196 [Triticum urartu]
MANLVGSMGLGNHDGVRTSRPVTRRSSAPEVDSPGQRLLPTKLDDDPRAPIQQSIGEEFRQHDGVARTNEEAEEFRRMR